MAESDQWLSGLIDLPGASAQFAVKLIKFRARHAGELRPRAGRNATSKYKSPPRWAATATGGVATAMIRLDDYPEPSAFEGQTGTIVEKWGVGSDGVARKITRAVIVTTAEYFKEDNSNIVKAVFTYEGTAKAEFSGWPTTQKTGGTPTRADEQQWAGTVKGYDPKGIQPPLTQTTIDWWGDLANTDDAEKSKLLAIVAAAAVPLNIPHNYKPRGASLGRDAFDGGSIILTWGLTDTEDDWKFARTRYDIDPQGLASQVAVAGVTTIPAVPAGLVDRGVVTETINDSKPGYTRKAGNRSTAADVTFEHSRKTDDQSDLDDVTPISLIQSTLAPVAPQAPNGLVLAETFTEQLTEAPIVLYEHVFNFKRRTNQQALEMDNSEIAIDPSALETRRVIALIQSTDVTTATPPNTPSGLKPYDQRSRQRHGASTGAKWLNFYEFRLTTRKEDIENESTVTQGVHPLDSAAIDVTVDPPSQLSDAPDRTGSNIKPIKYTAQELNDGATKTIWKQENLSTVEKIGFGKEHKSVDPHSIEDEAILWEEWTEGGSAPSTPSAPGNTKLLLTDDIPLTSDVDGNGRRMLRWWLFGTRSSKDKHVLDSYKTELDASGIDDIAARSWLDGDSEPANPDAAKFQADRLITKPLTLSLGTNRTLSIRLYARQTNRDKLVLPHTWTKTDPSDLESEAERSRLSGEAALAATVIDANGHTLSKTGSLVKQITHPSFGNLTQEVGQYGLNTNKQALEYRKTRYIHDANGILSGAEVAVLETSSAPAGYGATLVVGTTTLTFVNTLSDPQNPGEWLMTYRYGLGDSKQQLEREKTEVILEALDDQEYGIATVVAHTGTELALATTTRAATQSDSTVVAVKAKKLSASLALKEIRYGGGNFSLRPVGLPHTVREAVRGVPATAVVNYRYVPGNISPGDTDALVYIFFNGGDLRARPLYIYRSLGRFIFRRIYATDDFTAYQYLAVRGHVNAAPFLGYSAGEVIYSGPVAAYSFNYSGARRLIVDYAFQTDDYKFFNDGFLPEGRTAVLYGGIFVSGLASARQLEAGLVCTFPAQADFTGFTSA